MFSRNKTQSVLSQVKAAHEQAQNEEAELVMRIDSMESSLASARKTREETGKLVVALGGIVG